MFIPIFILIKVQSQVQIHILMQVQIQIYGSRDFLAFWHEGLAR